MKVKVVVVGLFLLVSVVGCKKKKPANIEKEIEETTTEIPEVKEEEVEAEPEVDLSLDKKPETLPEDIVELNQYVVNEGLLGDIFFDFDRFDLRPEARERLAKNAEFLKKHPELIVLIEGHCDERGTNEYNLALGDKRANAAKDFLVSLGVNPDNLKTISYGEEKPFCKESNEQCWQLNRRAHFKIISRSKE